MPWIFTPVSGVTNQFRLPQGTFLQFTMCGVIVIGLFKGVCFKNKYLALLMGYLLLHILFYFTIPFNYEMSGQRNVNVAILAYIPYILISFMFLTCLSVDYKKIAKVLCISVSLVAVFAILQFIGLDPLKSIGSYACDNGDFTGTHKPLLFNHMRVSACLDNPNVVGIYLAIISPLFLMFKNKWAVIGGTITVLGIGITKCNAAIACVGFVALASIIIKFRQNKKVLIGIGIIMVLCVFMMYSINFFKLHNGMDNRLPVWTFAFENFKLNTLFGVSLGKFQSFQFKYANATWNEAHNDWLQYLMEIGIVGIGLFITLIVAAFRNVRLANKEYALSLFVFLLAMIISFPIEVPSIAVIGLISFGALNETVKA